MKTQHRFLLLILAALICLLLGVVFGSVGISPGDFLAIIASKLFGAPLPESLPQTSVAILWNIRLPRALMAFLTGAMLSASGAVMQSLLRNPLASSYTLGVSSGASLMAAIVIVTGLRLPLIGSYTLPLFGFVGGLVTVLGAMALSARFDRSLSSHTVILVGMVLSLFVNACLTLVTALSADRLSQLVFWQMGSFSAQSLENCALTAPVLIVSLLMFMCRAREMDLMTFGEEQALSAGVELRRVKGVLIIVSALLTGTAVSLCGVIGFVDLIAPHVARRLFGSSHRRVVPAAALIGGGFMVVGDLLARTLFAPQELPVGAVTALIGAPFFAYVYFHREKGAQG